ncbi:MAG: HAD-IA family hydrolase [Candidatus Accumulibacter sp.]|jgi:phosphoglycolate phosphatase|nr:HAD-IA family hydrolase [Accumulibacter sp.]
MDAGRRFELLVFDWDGTLFDSTGAIASALQAACRALSIPEPSDEQARQGIGLGLIEALRHSIPDLSERHYPELLDRFGVEYRRRESTLGLYEGIPELIERLHASGATLCVATGKSRRGLDRVLASTGLGRFFSASRCADECFSKPHPQMLLELIDACFVSPETTLMIGDTTHDLQMAINAGARALAVSYGAHSAEQLNALNPLARVDSVAELDAWFRVHDVK